jgi:hypothetical protein
LRDNLTGRVALGRLSVEGLDMLFGSGHRDRVVALNGTPGRALAAHLAAGEVEPYGIQVQWLSTERLMPVDWQPAGTAEDRASGGASAAQPSAVATGVPAGARR